MIDCKVELASLLLFSIGSEKSHALYVHMCLSCVHYLNILIYLYGELSENRFFCCFRFFVCASFTATCVLVTAYLYVISYLPRWGIERKSLFVRFVHSCKVTHASHVHMCACHVRKRKARRTQQAYTIDQQMLFFIFVCCYIWRF